ncbi:MAG: SIR2 family protein [Planctomycetales bacterium]|nr:SIR2 family protein [Planctomycetales bacterium]
MAEFSILEEQSFPRRVLKGFCTPILGPELTTVDSEDRVSTAQRWFCDSGYDFDTTSELPRAGEYLTVACDRLEPRLQLEGDYGNLKLESRKDKNVYAMLADFQLPLYVCTSYHNLMQQALEADRIRQPNLQLLAWNDTLRQKQLRGDKNYDLAVQASPSHPVVMHWFGQVHDPESLVITEREYMDFLFNIAAFPDSIPPMIDAALSRTYVLFLGFRLFDIHFQTLLRSIKKNLINNQFVDRHIAVQFVDIEDGDDKQRQDAEDYLKRYLDQEKISVEVGSPVSFIAALHQKLKEAADGAATA